eukprot:Amastigsp_a174919_9.p3 type:complete len:161 gc:universal Amastigsp_a174919_9:553-1035(+)
MTLKSRTPSIRRTRATFLVSSSRTTSSPLPRARSRTPTTSPCCPRLALRALCRDRRCLPPCGTGSGTRCFILPQATTTACTRPLVPRLTPCVTSPAPCFRSRRLSRDSFPICLLSTSASSSRASGATATTRRLLSAPTTSAPSWSTLTRAQRQTASSATL